MPRGATARSWPLQGRSLLSSLTSRALNVNDQSSRAEQQQFGELELERG